MKARILDDAEKYLLRQHIASALDHPSVFMGGPSQQSVRKAIRIVSMLCAECNVTLREQTEADRVREWRKSPWDSLERV